MRSQPEKLLKKHPNLTQTDNIKVKSHVQRVDGDWIINTVMLEGCDVPFKYKRKKKYQSLQGQRVNVTYYPGEEMVANMGFEVMNVVRIKIS